MKKALNSIIALVKTIMRDDLLSLASEMAFHLILAIFPFIISIAAIFGLLSSDNIIDQIIVFLTPIAPSDVLNILKKVLTEINRASTSGILTLGFFGTLWAITGATDNIIKALNRAYKVEETRPVWITKGSVLFLVLLTALVLFATINLILFTSGIVKLLSSLIYIPHYAQVLISLSKWPITLIALFIIILLIYAFMPNIKEKAKVRILSSLPGAFFFCAFWTIASWLFGLYAENFSSYSKVYGTLTGVIIFLIWLYYTSLILLIGGEINAGFYKKHFVSKNVI